MEGTTRALPETLLERAHHHDNALALRFLPDGTGDMATDLTYADLAAHAAAAAGALEGMRGRRVLLAMDPGPLFVATLFGIFAAGATAVPSPPPDGRQSAARFQSIVADCSPDAVVLSERYAGRDGRPAAELPAVLPATARRARWLFAGEEFFRPGRPVPGPRPGARPCDPALIQYTSGSTGAPKGVVLTHDNLVANCVALDRHMGADPDRVGCSWLPPYHDMGLLGMTMLAVHAGWPLVMLSPAHFLRRPYRWLKAVSDHRATLSVAPAFALNLCVDAITDDEIETLDLVTLRHLYCGAEPLLRATLDRFRDRFAPCGYRESALVPCYGMAEATLFVSGKPDGTLPRTLQLGRWALELGRVQPTGTDETAAGAESVETVSCGEVPEGHEVIVVDPGTRRPATYGTVGEIWLRGPHGAAGYFGRPELTEETFGARPAGNEGGPAYLRTGDAGFLFEGELYVTGRLTDLVVIAGRTRYPHDIEATVLAAERGLRRAAAFPVHGGDGGTQLAIVAELRRAGRRTAAGLGALRETIAAAVTAGHGVRPVHVHIGPPGTIPITTSGKVRRGATREHFEHGRLKDLPGPAARRPGAAT